MADPKEDPFLDDPEAVEPEDESEPSTEDVELDSLRAERDDLKDRLLRALADAENARKRAAKDRQEAQAYGGTRIARDLLPVYDNLQRALAVAREDGTSASTALVEGVELTLKELGNVFDRHGVNRIEPQVGDRFDPQHHEAMFEAPVPNTKAGDIIQVSASGFMLHDRLLRPAQVGVSSTPAS
ncbi:nucleotide exchange factor GrpE [Citreimonas sp.]|uniref:nucleotide exchange factor GrpE n=1 Tax=Citreimonas sp. TaxID=3036715 RepID=UPI0035C82C9C